MINIFLLCCKYYIITSHLFSFDYSIGGYPLLGISFIGNPLWIDISDAACLQGNLRQDMCYSFFRVPPQLNPKIEVVVIIPLTCFTV